MKAALTDYKIAQSFWDSAKHMISVTERHPFLVSMVDGTLHVDNFQYYVIQDALYLKDFAECLRMLSRNVTEESPEDAKRLMEFAIGAEEAELSLHNSFFKEWQISDAAEGATPMPNTLLYTSNMMRVCATRSHAEGLACLLPCFWVYMHVGNCMLKLREDLNLQQAQQGTTGGTERPRLAQFDAWIDMYAGEDFANEVHDFIRMTDVAAQSASEEIRACMKEHFLMSVKLEHMFWDQAANLMEWPEIGVNNNEHDNVKDEP
mmetsp:Transcript_21016/g.32061  ORF Transcript_21016/g.32061 Transcript_21016/m.32061 type:complete len:262 (+) Transcript_21016:66-851(+)